MSEKHLDNLFTEPLKPKIPLFYQGPRHLHLNTYQDLKSMDPTKTFCTLTRPPLHLPRCKKVNFFKIRINNNVNTDKITEENINNEAIIDKIIRGIKIPFESGEVDY